MRAILFASVAAVLVQPLVFAALSVLLLVISYIGGATASLGDLYRFVLALGQLSIAVIAVAIPFVALIGVPLFLALRRHGLLGWRTITSAGFLAAALPFALIGFPLWGDSTGYSAGANWHGTYVQFVEDGVYTIYGWLNYLEEIVRFGIQGLVGALVFFVVWGRFHARYECSPSMADQISSNAPPGGSQE
jgi:hypothetical protein